MQNFVEFVRYVSAPENRHTLMCPACGSPARIMIEHTFNMYLSGRALINCTNYGCLFSKEPIIVESCASTNNSARRR